MRETGSGFSKPREIRPEIQPGKSHTEKPAKDGIKRRGAAGKDGLGKPDRREGAEKAGDAPRNGRENPSVKIVQKSDSLASEVRTDDSVANRFRSALSRPLSQ